MTGSRERSDLCPSCGHRGNPDVAEHDKNIEETFGRTFYCDNYRCRVTVFVENDLTWLDREEANDA